MFKTQVEPLACGSWFHRPSFEHFMASFLWSIRVQTTKKSGWFGFYNNAKKFSGISFILRCEIVKTKSARVALQIASFLWSILSSAMALNQSARENSDSDCKRNINHTKLSYSTVLSRDIFPLLIFLRGSELVLHILWEFQNIKSQKTFYKGQSPVWILRTNCKYIFSFPEDFSD